MIMIIIVIIMVSAIKKVFTVNVKAAVHKSECCQFLWSNVILPFIYYCYFLHGVCRSPWQLATRQRFDPIHSINEVNRA